MNTRIETVPHHSKISMHGCAYHLEGDQAFITIDKICSRRIEGNLSGHLRLQLRALFEQPDNRELCSCIIASTNVGELLGQQYLEHCHYALTLLEQPPGAGRFSLELSEWNGQDYIVCDASYFETSYEENPALAAGKTNRLVPQDQNRKKKSKKSLPSKKALQEPDSMNPFQQFHRFLGSLLSRSKSE